MAQITRILKCEANENIARSKTVGTFARLELRSQVHPYMFSFCAVLLGHDLFTETDRATTCRPRFKAPSASRHFVGNIVKKASQPFVKKKFESPWVFDSSWCEKSRFLCTCFHSVLTALTAFNRTLNGLADSLSV